MNAISFKNFRKFEKFPSLKLGGITYLVGGNNAGKSTVVKAMRLLLANLKSLQTIGTGMLNRNPVFYFDNPKDIHIGTFVKALRHGAERKAMTIEGELSPLNIGMDISLAENDAAYGMIDQIRLSNEKEGYVLTFDIINGKARLATKEDLSNSADIEDKIDLVELQKQLKERKQHYADLRSQFEKLRIELRDNESDLRMVIEGIENLKRRYSFSFEQDGKTMWGNSEGNQDFPITNSKKELQMHEMNDYATKLRERCEVIREILKEIEPKLGNAPFELHELQSRIEILKKTQKNLKPKEGPISETDAQIETPLSLALNYEGENVICQYINGMIMTLSTDKRIANPAAVQLLKQIREQFEDVLRGNNIEYVPAHAATQQTIFRISDENDNMAQLVHAWSRQQINPGDDEHQFIIRWMKSLGIGENFKVRPMEGEAYAVDIYEHNSDTTPATLSELGMGAIQAMTLLFRLSGIMRQYKEQKNKPMILIEEPEQNMHPSWQSHLADIFEEMRSQGFRLLVETHSEYLIRKSQLQVAAMKFVDQADLDENCPISTWYFPDKEAPYAMQYAIQGNFYKPFGTGFFDEADNLATRLML